MVRRSKANCSGGIHSKGEGEKKNQSRKQASQFIVTDEQDKTTLRA
jgi:hypothetical protein